MDPTGFREIIAANPLLVTGVYILLAMGGLLFLLGFLGCCGAIRENKCLLLFVSSPSPPYLCVPQGGRWGPGFHSEPSKSFPHLGLSTPEGTLTIGASWGMGVQLSGRALAQA